MMSEVYDPSLRERSLKLDVEKLQGRFSNLRFNVGLAIRYHKRRQSFYGTTNTIVNFITFTLATSSIAALIATQAGKFWSGVAIVSATIFGLFGQVFRLVEKEYTHKNLAEQYGDILQELSTALVLDHYDASDLVRLTSRFESLRSATPNTLQRLTDICYNEMVNEMGFDSHELVPINKWDRFIAPYGDFWYTPPPGHTVYPPQETNPALPHDPEAMIDGGITTKSIN